MPLPESDTDYLERRKLPHDISIEAGMTCVVFPGWKLPAGYSLSAADLMVRLPALYPDLPPDMWWFEPAIQLVGGRAIPATEVQEVHLGRTWQRWSRHLSADQWHPGIDGLESYLALINNELRRGATS